MARKTRYRRLRVDLFGHVKTYRMDPLAYCIMIMAIQNSIVGCLRSSPRAIASTFKNTTEQDVLAAMAELQERGIAKWWPDSDTLLIIEALDEQSFNHKTDASGVAECMALSPEVRQVLQDRYGQRIACNDSTNDSACSTVSVPDPVPVNNACAVRVLDYLNAARSEFVPGGNLADTTQIAGRLKEGRTEDECRLVVDGLVAQCRKDAKQVEWFDTVTPFRKANFDRALARAQVAVAKSKPTAEVDIAELARRQREERGE
jgi:hypothetical protein